jgi:predicted phosphodiesterase
VVVEDNGVTVAAESRTQYLASHGYHHVATLTDLTPGSDHSYHVDCQGQASETRTFHVPAADLSEAKFLVVGDMGYGEAGQAKKTRDRMEALKDSTDLTVHVGDIGYADDSFIHPKLYADCVAGFCYEAIADRYMDWMESHFDDKPFMVTPGNHESECHSPNCIANAVHKESLRNFSAYNARWAMPSKESGGAMNMWYSFDYGPVHFISGNTETDFDGAVEKDYGDGGSIVGLKAGHFGADGEYLRWLEADLQAAVANRAERPWIVAFGHRTWFYHDHQIKEAETTQPLRDLYEKYGVDLYLAGHVHAYSRHLPPAGSGGVPVVVTGAAGCDEGLEGWDKAEGTADDGYEYYTDGTVYQVGTIEVSRESLTWKSHNSETGDVFDTFTLTKQVSV